MLRLRRNQLPQARWAGLEVLATARDLNARWMSALAETARVPRALPRVTRALNSRESCATFAQILWSAVDS
jgi:hypothetical protein